MVRHGSCEADFEESCIRAGNVEEWIARVVDDLKNRIFAIDRGEFLHPHFSSLVSRPRASGAVFRILYPLGNIRNLARSIRLPPAPRAA
ncbi:MAG TPA: hypothetical protein VGC56_02520 [Allosphingosinicella sp.]